MGNQTKKMNKIQKNPKKSNISKKMGGDTDIGDTDSGESYVVTIAIITHGCIINLNPPQNYDIRYYSATGDKLGICYGNIFERSINHEELREHFRQDKPQHKPKHEQKDGTTHTVDAIPDYYHQIPYDKNIGKQGKKGFITDSINTVEEIISPLVTGDVPVGVWLISVHKKDTQNNIFNFGPSYTYDYPVEDKTNNINTNTRINLLNIESIKILNKKYNNIPNLDDKLKNDAVTIENGRIKVIRLSYLLDLIKDIMGNNCGLNVYDYSCSSGCSGYPSNDNKEQKILANLIKNTDDGKEAGKLPFFPINPTTGGKRRNKRKPRSTKKNKKSIKTRKNKFTKYLKGGDVKCNLREIENKIDENEHLIDTTDDLTEIEHQLMIPEINNISESHQYYKYYEQIMDLKNNIKKTKDLFKYINENKKTFYKISVYLFLIYYLMCQPQQPQPQRGSVKRKTRKNKRKTNK